MLESLLEKHVTLSEDDVMDFGEIRSTFMAHGIDIDEMEGGEEEPEVET